MKGRIGSFLLIMFGTVGVYIFSSMVVFLVIGMFPTWCVYIFTMKEKESFGYISMGGLNFVGCIDSLYYLWRERGDMSDVLELAGSLKIILPIYLIAMVGYVLYLFTPYVIVYILGFSADNRIRAVRREQKVLLDEWGSQVAGEVLEKKPKTDELFPSE